MTSITIDNIDDDLMRRLREQAERTGNSVADEVKTLLNLIVAHSGEKPEPPTLEEMGIVGTTIDDVDSDALCDLLEEVEKKGFKGEELLDAFLRDAHEREPDLSPFALTRKLFENGKGVDLKLPSRCNVALDRDVLDVVHQLAQNQGKETGEVASKLLRNINIQNFNQGRKDNDEHHHRQH